MNIQYYEEGVYWCYVNHQKEPYILLHFSDRWYDFGNISDQSDTIVEVIEGPLICKETQK